MEHSLQTENLSSLVLENQVLDEVQTLAEMSRERIGRPFKAYSKKAFSKFCDFSIEKKQKILEQTLTMQEILSSPVTPEKEESNVHGEWHLIEKALKFYGLHLKDDYQKFLQKDDVIEIYNAEHIQIFRTFNFYNYSAYSYMDLLVNEWFHLWERPSHLLQSLYAVGVSVVSGEKSGVISMDHIPEHVYKEIYNSEDLENFESRSVQCKFGHISPLYSIDQKVGGFIINCRVKVLAMGEETKSLSFI